MRASEQQADALQALANSRERGEADRARAVLLTLAGWISARIAEAFGALVSEMRQHEQGSEPHLSDGQQQRIAIV